MLAWIDLEMTGLDPARHTIVEIASLVTDDDLTLVEEGPDLVVHASPEQLADMDDFVRTMHTRSGLLADIEASTLTLAEAGAQTLAFLQAAHPRGPDGPPGRQLHRDRPALPGRAAARDRGLPPLPLGRRLDGQGAVPALAPRGLPGGAGQEGGAPGPAGHPRERGRAGLLPRRHLRPTPRHRTRGPRERRPTGTRRRCRSPRPTRR